MSDTLPEGKDQTTTTNTHQNPTVWHDCCKGYDHAPWCAGYKEADEQVAYSGPQRCWRHGKTDCDLCPAPSTTESETEKWRVGFNGDSVMCGHDYIVGHTAKKYATQIVTEHNQHQALVAEREALRAAIEVAIHNLNAGNDPKFLADYLRLTLDQQRSTSE